MLKKRILASTMASVMALSSVSVVAFADDVEAPKTEAVTRKQLEDYLKSLENFVEKDLDDYGTTMSEYFENAYAAAEVVVEDKDADADDITAAYQMLKAVKNKLRIYTVAELKDLVKDNESIYETENEMNEEFGDDIYESESWDAFEAAYESAEDCLEETDSKIINDAYAELEAAAKALEEKDSVTKSAFRSTYNQYIDLVDEMEEYEDWRRGKATVGGNKLDFTTAGTGKDIKGKVLTFGELKDVVKGDCNKLPVSIGAVETVASGSDNQNWITFGGYGSATTLREDVENAYKKFVTEKTSNKTTMSEIVGSYKAMKKAIEIFKGWEVDSVKRGSKSSIENLLDDYHDDIVTHDDMGAAAYGTDGTAANSIAKAMLGQIETGNSYTSGDLTLTWSDNKLVIDESAADKWKEGTVIKVNPDTGWFDANDTASAGQFVETTGANTKSIKLKKGDNLVKYLPINAAIIGTKLDGDCDDTTRTLKVGMTAFEECKKQDDLDAGERNYATAVTTTIDTRKTLNENSTKSAAYPLVYRVIKYALDDIFPEDDTYTKKEVADLVAKSNDLIDKTGDAAKFQAENGKLDEYRKAAKEWVAKATATKGYKDGDAVGDDASGVATTDWRYEVLDADNNKTIIGAGTNATTVYEALKGKYDALEKKLKKYPVSYGEIAETIAEVADGLDSNAYGSSTSDIKALAETVAYDLSTLNDWGKDDCETFDDDHNFLFYNRLNADDSPNEGEKALKKNYDALLKAMEEATAAPAKDAGDVDGDGVVTLLDAQMVLQGFLEIITLTADQAAAGDMDGDGDADLTDAQAILVAFLNS